MSAQGRLHPGTHWSHSPLVTRTTESAVRSRRENVRVSRRLAPGTPYLRFGLSGDTVRPV